ncbi:MAG: thioredoxin family protein [Flavobacteriales bacterium]|nr:thioredoxin family protein [Flavobacteriales bacterium]
MARTPTYQIPLGFNAPDFSLPDGVSGRNVSLAQLKGERVTVVMFICNHCPFVVHVQDELVRIANDYLTKGVRFIAISSNDVENYPQDGPEAMKAYAERLKFPFPYLFDESQEVAKAYFAACTPDISVFDAAMECVYRGQLDGARPGNDIPLSGKDLRTVLDCIINDSPVPERQIPSIGCNIKWKTGNEPDYF